jgi:4,5-dihydroxyphthalate decarboxylase
MSRLSISLSVCAYDRTAALFDGRVGIEGCDVNAVALEPEESFHRAYKSREFDVTELSLSSHTMTTARGEAHYVGIPAFVSRLFRHSSIYVRTDRGIRVPQDLKGKTIGLPEYQMTANVWVRGILQDEYGVHPRDIKWRSGGLEDPGREERAPIKLPADVELKQIPRDRTLSDMLEKGEIDGLLSARAPSCFLRGAPNVDRLFPNYPQTEEGYFKKTGIFPIMHLIGVRRSLAEAHPWLPVSILKAFMKAKDLCSHELGQIGHLHASLPWGVYEYERLCRVMGPDYWSYGMQANRKTLETLARYSYEQGLSVRLLPVEEMFFHSTHELTKI